MAEESEHGYKTHRDNDKLNAISALRTTNRYEKQELNHITRRAIRRMTGRLMLLEMVSQLGCGQAQHCKGGGTTKRTLVQTTLKKPNYGGNPPATNWKEQRYDYWNNTTDCLDSCPRGRVTRMATQQELGVLPNWRTWTRCRGSARAGSCGTALAYRDHHFEKK